MRQRVSGIALASTVLPERFSVGVAIGDWQGGGELLIATGSIALTTGPALRRLTSIEKIEHAGPTVTLILARFGLPWMNTSIVVRSVDAVGIATTWGFARRRVRGALRAAGFTIEEQRTWISPGDPLRYSRGSSAKRTGPPREPG